MLLWGMARANIRVNVPILLRGVCLSPVGRLVPSPGKIDNMAQVEAS
jgi:hypothetical protein